MRSLRKTAAGAVKYILVLLVCILVLLPFVIMVSYSLRTTQNIFSLDHGLFPKQPTLQAYKNAIQTYNFSGSGFGTWSWNIYGSALSRLS